MLDGIDKTELAKSCEDYLLHRYIPLHSTDEQDIINHALKEGYQLGRFLAELDKTA